ncbi:MAG TPA: sigma-70 family RNA polymerase sigma factor [Planctomycetota bacterium]|nr:sigma-70 family RNA polymerase sigma factor [Planctomycetota bacterium]
MTSLPSERPRETRDTVARFETWVVAHHAAVYRSAWRITRNGADAEDVAQRVFLHVFERLGRPEWTSAADPGDRLRWLAVRTALDFKRSEANRRRREEARAMETSESVARLGPDPARAELLAKLRSSVAHLPDDLRVATVLRFQEGLTFAAMAELAGTSEPTVFERVKRALEKLRVALAQAGHAHALLELEALLAVEESVAVPGRLCATLLALPAAATATVATAASGAWLAAAVAVVVLVGGGAVAVHAVRSSRSAAQEEARESSGRAGRDGGGEVASTAPLAAATAEPARVADGHPAGAAEAAAAAARGSDGRMRAGDLLSSDMVMPPGVNGDDRRVETAHLRGVVVDDDGRPLAKAHVDASSSEGAPKAFAWRAVAESGADGRFDLRVAAVTQEPQPYVVVLDHADMLRRKVDATVTPGGTTDLARVEMKRNAADRPGDFELSLTVVGPEGRPVPRAIVRMFRKLLARTESTPRFEWQAGGLTDERGTIVLAGQRLGEKRFEIHARAAGCRDLVVDRTIDAIGASEATVVLEAGLTVEGRLVAPAGDEGAAALRGARLDAIAYDALELEASGAVAGEPFDAAIAPDGSFVVRGLAPGRHRLRVCGDFSTAWVDPVEAGTRDVSLQLKRADDPSDAGLHRAEIHGRVVDERGAPLAIDPDVVELFALPADWKPDDPRVESEFVPALLAPDFRQQSQVLIVESRPRPGPSSAFHKNDLDAGSYVVVVKAAGRKPGVSAVVTVAENQLARDVVVMLHTQ